MQQFERVVQILNLKLGLRHAVDIISHAVQLTWQAQSFRPDYRNLAGSDSAKDKRVQSSVKTLWTQAALIHGLQSAQLA